MIVRPYEQYDEQKMCFQTSQAYMGEYVKNMDVNLLAESGTAWTAESTNQVIAMGGVAPLWENRGQAWMLISPEAGKHMVALHRAVKEGLLLAPYRRIEATVDVGFKPGVRWMKMLGFELEGYMKAYRPDGADMLLFARVRR